MLLLGAFCFLIYFLLRSLVWKIILQKQSRIQNLSFLESFYLWELAEIKRFIPGKIWPIVARASYFSQKGISAKIVIKSMLNEMQFLITGSLLVSFFSIPFITRYFLPKSGNATFFLVLGIVTALLLILFLIFGQKRIFFAKYIFLPFSWKSNLIISFYCALYMFMFGLGTYLTIASFIKIPQNMLFELTGFFTLSFLISFLSFITPMGLGVREGLITLGLSKIISLSAAGFSSIYVRIVAIVSELIFLLALFLWKKLKK